jgi:GntP family gluconate:H+ symporter
LISIFIYGGHRPQYRPQYLVPTRDLHQLISYVILGTVRTLPLTTTAMHPLLILAVGIVTIIGLIVVFRVHAFISLIVSAILVSALAPGPIGETVSRVAVEFGKSAGNIGIVIALASVIGACMMESGAADRIVRAFLRLLGESRAPFALLGSGYVLAMPVFFDTVFYLLVPLARSLYLRTRRNYLLYLIAIAAGGATTHTLVPPTPGPLLMAAQLNVDLGIMILMGLLVALPAALCGVAFGAYVNRIMPIPLRETPGVPISEPLPDDKLPPLGLSLLPVILPVLMITTNTIVKALASDQPDDGILLTQVQPYTQVIGDPNLALLVATVVAVALLRWHRRATLRHTAELMEKALMSGGVIILITAAGGAFGAMLKAAQIGPAIEEQFKEGPATGFMYLFLGFGVAAVLKIAQGSSTVAMITASSMLAAMIGSGADLGYHPVYLALAIGSGSLLGSWMNDSGFWIFAKMGGLTEVETLKSWTLMLGVLSVSGMAMTTVLVVIFPLR